MSGQTLEQKRAANALACVENVAKNKEMAGLYRSYAESLPAHIVMGGFGQAIATELAAARLGDPQGERKDGPRAHAQLAADLAAWVGPIVYPGKKSESKTWLISVITSGDEKEYLHAQAEALAWLVWLKKFCQALLPKKKGEEE